MSAPLLPSGLRPGDGLGDFITFTTDGGYRAAGATKSYDDEDETYRGSPRWSESVADTHGVPGAERREERH